MSKNTDAFSNQNQEDFSFSEKNVPENENSIDTIHPDKWIDLKDVLSFIRSGFASSNDKEDTSLCEDADPFIENCSRYKLYIGGVADGLGGYSQGFNGKSGGYIASREAIQITKNYLEKNIDSIMTNTRDSCRKIANEIRNLIEIELKKLANENIKESKLKGTLSKHKLATTLAFFTAFTENNETQLHIYWIGDSRIYYFDKDYFYQLTKDHTTMNVDAYSGISNDSPMSKFLASTMEECWDIDSAIYGIGNEGVLICCTDGCSAYWNAPWEFELALLNTLRDSNSWPEWIANLKKSIAKVTRDDASLVMYPVNNNKFSSLKNHIKDNGRPFVSNLMNKLNNNEINNEEMWGYYKEAYESNIAIKKKEIRDPTTRAVSHFEMDGENRKKIINHENDSDSFLILSIFIFLLSFLTSLMAIFYIFS